MDPLFTLTAISRSSSCKSEIYILNQFFNEIHFKNSQKFMTNFALLATSTDNSSVFSSYTGSLVGAFQAQVFNGALPPKMPSATL